MPKKQGSSAGNGKQWLNGGALRRCGGKPYTEDEKKKFQVINVSYNDAKEYCRWLSAKSGKT